MDGVVYLGYIVGGGKVKPTDSKIQAVKDFPQPKTKTDVLAFSGLSGYYRSTVIGPDAQSSSASNFVDRSVFQGICRAEGSIV